MTSTALPVPKAVRDLLSDLLGRDVEVNVVDAFAPGEKDLPAVATFVDDRLGLRALAVCDLPLAARLAACIALVPKGGADAAIEDRELSANLRDNLYEILNIMSALFNAEGAPHLRLHALHAPGQVPPTDVSSWVRAVANRLDLTVDVHGYGAGRLSVILTA